MGFFNRPSPAPAPQSAPVPTPDPALEFLLAERVSPVVSVTSNDGKKFLIASDGSHDIRADIFRLAIQHHLTLIGLTRKENHLEEVFHRLTMSR